MSTAVFRLPDRLADKALPRLIAADADHLARVARRIAQQLVGLRAALDEARRSTDVRVEAGVVRDQEIRRLSARIRTLSRIGTDACLGRMVRTDGTVVYLGRLGLSDADGSSLLIDWRTAEAAPFFAATLADPMGLVSRRHYRWSRETIVDYWDELLATTAGDAAELATSLDSQSGFIASLGASRSPKMASVLGTIAADQDAAIRADSHGPLVVDGGPGTGKTVVALHRAAYLLYSDPRLQGNRGAILIVGPHRSYLNFISEVLPSLGEEGVATCALPDLVPGQAAAEIDANQTLAQLKSSMRMVDAVDAAVAFYEEPPTAATAVDLPWCEIEVTAQDWAEAFAAVGRAPVHNEAREEIWDVLVEILTAKVTAAVGDEASEPEIRAALSADRELTGTLHRAWPMLDAAETVSDLWAVPAYLRRCAPWLAGEDIALLRRPEESSMTRADLPLLDAAYRRLGDATAADRKARRRAQVREQQRVREQVTAELIAGDDGEGLVAMLRAEDIASVIVDETAMAESADLPLAGPFAHIVVDEAQDLTDAEWQMLLARCPSRSFTIVGDRAQSRAGFAESWADRLTRVGVGLPRRTTLTVNYRTPAEVMAVARPEIRAVLPGVDVPESIRSSGNPVRRAATSDLDDILRSWLQQTVDGTACVIGASTPVEDERVTALTPITAKGLEFDLVILVNPAQFGDDIAGAVDRYVAMTRTTSQLVVLEDMPSGDQPR